MKKQKSDLLGRRMRSLPFSVAKSMQEQQTADFCPDVILREMSAAQSLSEQPEVNYSKVSNVSDSKV